MLIFDSIRKMDRDNVDNYKTIMKCETLRDNVKAYISMTSRNLFTLR